MSQLSTSMKMGEGNRLALVPLNLDHIFSYYVIGTYFTAEERNNHHLVHFFFYIALILLCIIFYILRVIFSTTIHAY